MKGTLVEKQDIAKGTGYFRFAVEEDVVFVPGQYFHIKFRDDLKHHFTIANSPNEKRIISVATRLRDTEFKNTLRALPIGGIAEIYKIKGEFVLPERTDLPLVFIALGIGITPYISMLRYIAEESLPYRVTLMYSESDRASMAFFDELMRLSSKGGDFKLIPTLTRDPSWPGERRRIDGTFVREYVRNPEDALYLVSGPPKAVEAVVLSLKDAGVQSSRIMSEVFPGY